MNIVCLDMEGVLVPEIWIAFSEATGIPELRRTTRDEPDYDKLMKYRLAILKEHGLGLKEIQDTIRTIEPFPGAKAGSVPPEALWKALEDWLASPGRTALVRFQRFLVPGGPALVRHWTAARAVEGDSLELYDCSIQENAVRSIPEFGFATDPQRIGLDRLLLVEPEHVRFLESAFGERRRQDS